MKGKGKKEKGKCGMKKKPANKQARGKEEARKRQGRGKEEARKMQGRGRTN